MPFASCRGARSKCACPLQVQIMEESWSNVCELSRARSPAGSKLKSESRIIAEAVSTDKISGDRDPSALALTAACYSWIFYAHRHCGAFLSNRPT
jgi:hypothetical protein